MIKWYKLCLIPIIFILFILPFSAYASGGQIHGDRIIIGGKFTLDQDEVLDGNLIAIGGDISLTNGSKVNEDVVLIGGKVDSSATIEGSFISIGAKGVLHDGTSIKGDFFTLGGQISREDDVTIDGEVITGEGIRSYLDFPVQPLRPPVFMPILPHIYNFGSDLLFSVLWLLFHSLLFAALSIVISLIFPKPPQIVANTIIKVPVISWSIGFLTIIVLPFILVFLGITIILIPVSLVGFLALAVALFLGWISIGYEIGRRVEEQYKQGWSSAVATGIGTFTITLLGFGIVRFIPCIGWMIPYLVLLPLGLGAGIITHFGTQLYPIDNNIFNKNNAIEATSVIPPSDSHPTTEKTENNIVQNQEIQAYKDDQRT